MQYRYRLACVGLYPALIQLLSIANCFPKKHKSPWIEARKRCPPRTISWAPSRQLAQVLAEHVLYAMPVSNSDESS